MKKYFAAAAFAALTTSATASPVFQLTFIPGTSVAEQQSFTAAAALWSAAFTDNVTVKLTVGTGALPANVLAQAGSRRLNANYSDIRDALTADSTTARDAVAVANLNAGNSVGLLMNRVSDNPNGATSFTGFVDDNGSANNTNIRLTAANARALGFSFGVGGVAGGCLDCDAFIQFSNAFTWDHDSSNGIAANAFDFVGIAAHEIGHALGFVSGVDTMDANATGQFSSNQFTFVSVMDLFRWSPTSAASDVIDWRAGNDNKYFSIDRGDTLEALFSTGQSFGDGRQASHWKDNLGIGILDPTAGLGELLTITEQDLRAFDAIGWDRVQATVPEPGTLALFGLALAGVGWSRRKNG